MQTSFLENLIGVNGTDESVGDVVFPKGFEVRDFAKLRQDFEHLASWYWSGNRFLMNLKLHTRVKKYFL